jgi:hypothetical protein
MHALAMVVRHGRRDDGTHGADTASVSGGSMQCGKAGHEPTSAGCRRDSHGHLALEELAAHGLCLPQVLSDLHRVHARPARGGLSACVRTPCRGAMMQRIVSFALGFLGFYLFLGLVRVLQLLHAF